MFISRVSISWVSERWYQLSLRPAWTAKCFLGLFLVISFSGSGIRSPRREYLSNLPIVYEVASGLLPTDLVLNFKLLKGSNFEGKSLKAVGFF